MQPSVVSEFYITVKKLQTVRVFVPFLMWNILVPIPSHHLNFNVFFMGKLLLSNRVKITSIGFLAKIIFSLEVRWYICVPLTAPEIMIELFTFRWAKKRWSI